MKEDNSAFVAQAFNSNQGQEAIEGSILFERLRLRFVAPNLTLEFPLARLAIQRDETTAGRLCLSGPDQPDWVICTFDARILQHRSMLQQPFTRNQIRALDSPGEFKRRLKITLGVLGGFAVVAVVISALTGIMVRALVARIPPQWEQQLGDNLMADLKQTETFVQDTQLLARVDRAVAPLLNSLPKSDLQYKFYLLEDPMPNAFALPGGHVLVTTGLLALAHRPE